MNVFVVTGLDDVGETDVYGVFSTKELAEECYEHLKEELDYLTAVFIEEVKLDAFGHR